jgi:hypothetical protein
VTNVFSILITMEWTKRELEDIQAPGRVGMVDTVLGNVHGALKKVGLMERNGEPTLIGELLGQTTQERSKQTLQRTFDYLLTTLEENITNELNRADVLFQLFESIEQQFVTLHRSVVKEEANLDKQKEGFLAEMWINSVHNKRKLKKFEKNLKLYRTVRQNTLANKSELKRHIQVIRSVRSQLEKARLNLVSPLIRSAQSNSFGLEHQLADLSGTYGFLKEIRDTQKHKVLKQLFAEPKKRVTITAGGEEDAEEADGVLAS